MVANVAPPTSRVGMKDEDDITMDDARSRERTTTNIPPFIPAWCIDKGGLSIVPLEIVPQEESLQCARRLVGRFAVRTANTPAMLRPLSSRLAGRTATFFHDPQ